MEKTSSELTVYFEDPFWVGVFTLQSGGKLSASKVTFGAEPKDYDVKAFVEKNYYFLKFSPGVEIKPRAVCENPKKLQRNVKKQLNNNGAGTKSQQALKLLQEENKLARKTVSREQREAEKQRAFSLRQQKKKEKHKGK